MVLGIPGKIVGKFDEHKQRSDSYLMMFFFLVDGQFLVTSTMLEDGCICIGESDSSQCIGVLWGLFVRSIQTTWSSM